ncbi:helix-turn-helix transcriptional regulator [Gordonia sp. X0973]|uniref:helix-turn-helix domain-containing protein n=1 Tax=Gordonia sp. X0973 TaxID=2742602 RepID=UPI000F53063A|nr:helix-turn-helix domain-containing protein [Gordonia sp. X0973]QKT06761.1 helix-turn-helix transcriptional regulator [Gordonia sp. X0973]
MPELASIGEAIAQRRRELNLTQQALADLSGVSRSSVQALEYGSGSVRLEAVVAVTDSLGIPLSLTRTERDA